MQNNLFKISKESVIELVKRLIDKHTDSYKLYDNKLQLTKYVYTGLDNKFELIISDAQQQSCHIKYRNKLKYVRNNPLSIFKTLKISIADKDLDIFVEAVNDDECKRESVLNVPIKFYDWSLNSIVPKYFSIRESRQTIFPRFYISYGGSRSNKSRTEITQEEHRDIITAYATIVNQNNMQKNINAELMISKHNSDMLIELLDANKIEKKLC